MIYGGVDSSLTNTPSSNTNTTKPAVNDKSARIDSLSPVTFRLMRLPSSKFPSPTAVALEASNNERTIVLANTVSMSIEKSIQITGRMLLLIIIFDSGTL
jgi:hypothetical protein